MNHLQDHAPMQCQYYGRYPPNNLQYRYYFLIEYYHPKI